MRQSDQSLKTFKIGDKVVFDVLTFDSDLVTKHDKDIRYLDRGVFTIVGYTSMGMELDRKVFTNDSNAGGWPEHHFKLAKNQIINEIIKDLL